MSDVKLLPCSFVHTEDDGEPIFAVVKSGDGGFYAECNFCWARGPQMDTEAEAIAAWNTRPADALTPKQAAAIASDGPCGACGLPCECWFTDSPMWNQVNGGATGLLCLRCFVTKAESMGIQEAWRLHPDEPAPATPKQKAADEMFAKLDKVARWLESLADISEKQIETCRFESLNEAYRADAKNYKATARDIRSTLAKAGQP